MAAGELSERAAIALLLRLRFRVLLNTLRRNVLQLVLVILGGVQGTVVAVLAIVGLVLLGLLGGDEPGALLVRQRTVVTGGLVLTLGWMIVPLITSGVENTLDPRRLARFPIRVGTLMRAQVLVGLTWIPGVLTLLVALAAAAVWRGPAIPVAIVCAVPGVLICVVGSRLAASLTTAAIASRRTGVRAGVIAAALTVLVLPIAAAVLVGMRAAEPVDGVVDALAWSPLAVIWSAPGLVATGHPLAALGAVALGLVVLAVLVAAWRASVLAVARTTGDAGGRAVAAGRLGALRWMPASPAGAIAARSLTSWFRDTRYTRQLVVVPLLPVLLIFWARLVDQPALAIAVAPMVAGLLPLTMFSAISYDGTAFAGQLMAPVPGWADRIGRAAAIGLIAGPATVVIAVVGLAVVGRLDLLPPILGMSAAVLLGALGVISVSSALVVVPVPRTGRNPFAGSAGAGMTSVIGSYAVTGITAAVGLPTLVPGVLAIVFDRPVLGWATLVVGLVEGAILLAIGVRVGGRLLDRRGPEILTRLRSTGV
ncbi:transporter [Schumannella soli]|uniref:Transporter n=1 Tax=Schumannella soli TaxID=2590779 RepID=A0A506XWA6_9MICO|nr:transporter [Schumannella soli]TPW77194.1 transporter [Schumannella soli]